MDQINGIIDDIKARFRGLIEINLPSSIWSDLIIPITSKLIPNKRERIHLCFANFNTGWIFSFIEFGINLKPLDCFSVAN